MIKFFTASKTCHNVKNVVYVDNWELINSQTVLFNSFFLSYTKY